MKFYLKYGLNLNYLLTYVAETKVIFREIYSILIVNYSLLKHLQVIEVMSLAHRIAFYSQGFYKITLRVQDIDSDQRTRGLLGYCNSGTS